MNPIPAPWIVSTIEFNDDKRGADVISVLSDGVDAVFIADVWKDFEPDDDEKGTTTYPRGTGMANARLIAAAPRLLAALKAAKEWIDPDEHGLYDVEGARRDLAECEAAIAQAEES